MADAGASRELSTCSMHFASNVSRMAAVPMTVIGLPLSPGAGMKPVASPVGRIGVGLLVFISNFKTMFQYRRRRG